ncbi:MAG: DUF1566 domain-containing protein [Thermodesulfobacteriota bacterium]
MKDAQARPYLATGQTRCFDSQGEEISCTGQRQDGAVRAGQVAPEPRFVLQGEVARDRLTGLVWPVRADVFGYPLRWEEALGAVAAANASGLAGYTDWRLPNRRELRSLIDHSARNPALPLGHPFTGVYLGWYWTSTTAAIAPGYAWYVHFAGGRMFYGKKTEFCLVWPVRGDLAHLPRTGQTRCFDGQGKVIDCRGSGQDGAAQQGVSWPETRFVPRDDGVLDRLTGLVWRQEASEGAENVEWSDALSCAEQLAAATKRRWRVPSINELESLVDASQNRPALPARHPFTGVQEAYWSSTTSGFETDWAYALYLHKGAVGVGWKRSPGFAVWCVREA